MSTQVLTVLNLLSHSGEPAAARQFISHSLHALSLFSLIFIIIYFRALYSF